MHAERTPFAGIVLAVVETVGLLAYTPAPDATAAASVTKPDSLQHFKRVKARCRR